MKLCVVCIPLIQVASSISSGELTLYQSLLCQVIPVSTSGFVLPMPKNREFQFVWPEDSPKGSSRRGFFDKLRDIVTGKGPDMFIQKAGSKEPIKAGEWGNW